MFTLWMMELFLWEPVKMSWFIYHGLSANKNLLKCISRFETLYLWDYDPKNSVYELREPFVCVQCWPYQSILHSFWLDIFITFNIILLPSQLDLLIFTIYPNSFNIQDKTGCLCTGFKNSPPHFFQQNFCIFLFVERCFWLDAPALYHSAPHAFITTLCKA